MPREMKGRYVQREWFADYEFMTGLNAYDREVYLGLAMFTDSGGWLPWNLPEIANSIYRFVAIEEAMQRVSDAAAALEKSGRLKRYRCGHAFMPKVAKYQRAGGVDRKVEEDHRRCSGGRNRSTKVEESQPRSTLQPYLTLPNRTIPNGPTKKARVPAREAGPANPDGPVRLGESPTMQALREMEERRKANG